MRFCLCINTFHFQWEDLYILKLNWQTSLQVVIEKTGLQIAHSNKIRGQKFWYLKNCWSQNCFKEVFLIVSSFLTELLEYAYVLFVDRFTSLREMLLILTKKKIFWMLGSWFAFCFHFGWLDAAGAWSQKNSSTWGMLISDLGNQMLDTAHSCRPLDDNKTFSKKKHEKRWQLYLSMF